VNLTNQVKDVQRPMLPMCHHDVVLIIIAVGLRLSLLTLRL